MGPVVPYFGALSALRGVDVREQRVDHVVGERTRGCALALRDLVSDDRERELVCALDAEVAGDRR